MKVIYRNLKEGEVKVRVENVDDLWYLSTLIDEGDVVKAETERKIKIGDSTSENTRVVRKKMYLALTVEKVEFSPGTNQLRILGTIVEGPDDIPRGAHHSFGVEVTDELRIVKEEWLSFQLDKLTEAEETSPKILIVVFDREEAMFGILKAQGFEVVAHLKGDVAKKAIDEKKQGNFYKDVAVQLEDLARRYQISQVIAGSQGFWKEYLAKEIPSPLKDKVTYATCSDVSAQAINELLKRPELKTVLEKDRTAKEDAIVEKVLQAIAKEKASYGIKELLEKAKTGSVLDLVVSSSLIQKSRERGLFKEVDGLMRLVEKTGGKVHIVSTDAAIKRIDALGGCAGVLRWT
jgi:protein pelota